ncbi:tubulin monoglutamylase TTLL4 [Ptiloglossa arizonensis]|uniref:tubulin monoglutamylase TTLL4 n=1 Tax=Ptiloglossa arizonensis TaxID=3350558 RepID=UPI003FA14A3E
MRHDRGHSEPCRFGDVATSTFGGTIGLDRNLDDEWLTYELLTERAFLHSGAISSVRRPIERASSETRREQTPRSIQPENTVHGPRGEIIFDDRANGDKVSNDPPPWMRKSLFRYVPPYFLFPGHERGFSKKLPNDVAKLFKWKYSAKMPKILLKILSNLGHRLTTRSTDWAALWYAGYNDSLSYRFFKDYQKVNSIPGSRNLGNKALLWINLSKMTKKFGAKEFGFVPKTYLLPEEIRKFEYEWLKYNVGSTWIIKPTSASCGQGIKVVDRWCDIPKFNSVIVQRYISKPKLVNGSKFDLRVYVLATCINPTRIYIYKEGLVRFASVRYVRGVNLSDKYMHLTNVSVNKLNPAYVPNDSVDSFRGHKWSFGCLWFHLIEKGVDVAKLWSTIKDIVVKTLIAAESSMNAAISENLASSYTCYELYGFDVLLDENLKPWLLEVNILPSLQTNSSLDTAIKGPLVRNVLNMVGYQIPNERVSKGTKTRCGKYDSISQNATLYSKKLNLWETTKQKEINVMRNRHEYLERIVERLTRDDLRQLIRYEDELSQIGNFEKIFPTNQSYPYLKFFDVERYYDRLLDAWECRYSGNRQAGIERLNAYCVQMKHLDPSLDD